MDNIYILLGCFVRMDVRLQLAITFAILAVMYIIATTLTGGLASLN